MKEINKILQEEIADRVIYETRLGEETLRRGLQSAETRLSILLEYSKKEAIENYKGHIMEYINKNYSRSAQPLYAHVDAKELLEELKKN